MTQSDAKPPLLVVVLAAGKGTRMTSSIPKVLHPVGGRSMLAHVLALSQCVKADRLAVVIGPGMDTVRAEVDRLAPGTPVVIQTRQQGTADAVLAARDAIASHVGDVMVLYALADGAGVAVLGFHAADPTGYGRLLTDGANTLLAIREEKDATTAERAVSLCNSGVMAFNMPHVVGLLERIGNANAKGEYYLTDAVELARADGTRTAVVVCPETEVLGVNARDQLAVAERLYQNRARADAMVNGATLIAPETVFFSYDTRIGRDCLIEPNVFFGPGVTIADNVTIRANCHIEGASIGPGARIGPFARLRPGAKLAEDVHIGNFVEVKNVAMAARSKANHLAYLGDGTVGTDANVGAGTIFCNYDGFHKHKTDIGDGAFIGSNASLVAPVKIGAGAYVGSGSVITKAVSPGALAISRAPQDERPGWAEKFRQMMGRRK
jgi:bifunctional UDP-N-acetylglucosamine pyrophosphorylase / glucosamine-1-phosphate N-acetyltransferase